MNITPKFQLIMPLNHTLTYVKDTLHSIISHTAESYHLKIIDYGHDEEVTNYVSDVAVNHDTITIKKMTDSSFDYKDLNIIVTDSPFTVFIGSSVIVPPGWLTRLYHCLVDHPEFMGVMPLTNESKTIYTPLISGWNIISIDDHLNTNHNSKVYETSKMDFYCLLVKSSEYQTFVNRESLDKRAFNIAIASNTYVYQKLNDKENCELEQVSIPSLKRKMVWSPKSSMRLTYRTMRSYYRQRKWYQVFRSALKGISVLPKARMEKYIDLNKADVNNSRLKITYVVPTLAMAGGILSVVQLVNELILLGVDARIATLAEYPDVEDWKFFTKPIVYRNLNELVNNFPESDIVVATHWSTAFWIAKIMAKGKAKASAYFIQDYESWFYPPSDVKSRSKVKKSYKIIENRIVKSDWLQNLLRGDGYSSTKITLGMDLGIFYRRNVKAYNKPTIVSMARPSTPRRGFTDIVSALKIVKEKRPEVNIVFFGDDLSEGNIPFEFINKGIITNQDELAKLYSLADVYLDGSVFQGFGRPALEAMACGAACVLTNVGGVTEYARHEVNCLLVPPKSPDEFASAIIRILDDRNLKERLIAGGYATVQNYCHKREARRSLEFFKTL